MRRPLRGVVRCVFTVVIVLACASQASARFVMPPPTPIPRLVQNLEAYIGEHPDDVQGYYVLGRVHYLAYATKARELAMSENNPGKSPPSFAPYMGVGPQGQNQGQPPKGATPDPAELDKHLRASIAHFRKAIQLDARSGLAKLGLACVLEEGSPRAASLGDPDAIEYAKNPKPPKWTPLKPGQVELKEVELQVAPVEAAPESKPKDPGKPAAATDPKPTPYASPEKPAPDAKAPPKPAKDAAAPAKPDAKDNKDTKPAKEEKPAEAPAAKPSTPDVWMKKAAAQYWAAHELAIADNLKLQQMPITGLHTLVGYEAGKSYLRLAEKYDDSADRAKRIETATKNIKALDNLRMGPITPIVFSLDRARGLNEFIDTNRTTAFDLDGTGRGQRWPWLKPTTAVLVWDPERTGKIASGKQLFGTVAFDMFWRNGYDALDALDDNRDGWLTGGELEGLAAWIDRDGDGVTRRGEVTPLADLGVTGLAVRPTTHAGDADRSPANPRGLRMSDGRVLPTYDWLARPIATDKSRATGATSASR